jgi:hypothetical protein
VRSGWLVVRWLAGLPRPSPWWAAPALPGTLPRVTWSRQIEIDPRVRGFKLQFNQADFK